MSATANQKPQDEAQRKAGLVCTDLFAFVVTTDYAEASVLVFAATRSKAKSIAHGSEWLCDEDWTSLQVKREPGADKYAAKYGERWLQCETADEQRVLRELGWHQIDQEMTECCKCGLHEWVDVPESQLEEIGDIGEMICAGCKANDPDQRP